MRKLPNETGSRPLTSVAPSEVQEDVSTSLDTNGAGGNALARGSHTPERTCILTREAGARGDLIRLAISPDGQVLPDIRAKAPGRGAWIGVDRAALDQAQAKGKLRGALNRAFKGAPLSVPDDLSARIEAGLRQAMLDRLGLEARAGNVLIGAERIETALRQGKVHLLLHAADASVEGRRKLDQALRVGTDQEGTGAGGVVFPETRATLSLALGRQNVVHVAMTDLAAAARVEHALGRWTAFIGRDAELEAASAGPSASAVDVNEGLE